MTVAEIMQQAQHLSAQERKELVKLLIDSLEVTDPSPNAPKSDTDERSIEDIKQGIKQGLREALRGEYVPLETLWTDDDDE